MGYQVTWRRHRKVIAPSDTHVSRWAFQSQTDAKARLAAQDRTIDRCQAEVQKSLIVHLAEPFANPLPGRIAASTDKPVHKRRSGDQRLRIGRLGRPGGDLMFIVASCLSVERAACAMVSANSR